MFIMEIRDWARSNIKASSTLLPTVLLLHFTRSIQSSQLPLIVFDVWIDQPNDDFFYMCLICIPLLEQVTCQTGYSLIPNRESFISESFASDVSNALQKSAKNQMGSISDADKQKNMEILKAIIDLAEKYKQNHSREKRSAESDKKIAERSSINDVNGSKKVSSADEFLRTPFIYQRLRPHGGPVTPKSRSNSADNVIHHSSDAQSQSFIREWDQVTNHPQDNVVVFTSKQ